MFAMTIPDFILTMAAGLLIMGLICLAVGIYMLVAKAAGQDVRSLATSTAKLAQKGIADDVSGLVGNASNLVSALNELVRTTAGIGIFLIFISFALFVASYLLIGQIH
jgi:hypothetical protein